MLNKFKFINIEVMLFTLLACFPAIIGFFILLLCLNFQVVERSSEKIDLRVIDALPITKSKYSYKYWKITLEDRNKDQYGQLLPRKSNESLYDLNKWFKTWKVKHVTRGGHEIFYFPDLFDDIPVKSN